MNILASMMVAITVALCGVTNVAVAMSAPSGSGATALATSAAIDADGRLWIAYALVREDGNADVLLRRTDDAGMHWATPIRVTPAPEPVSADGENRPKLAFGPHREVYVTWTTPTSDQYTGDIRYSRSLDGGATWSAPAVVHRDRQLITHRFESLIVDGAGRVWVTWIDKRDLQHAGAAQGDYAGAAIYYAWSDDQGASWHGDFKLADHSCECCRIALAVDPKGRAVAMWRHVFPPNERDHAFAVLEPRMNGKRGAVAPASVRRATFDRWRIDACPHHGPSLAIGADGVQHAVWFNQVDGAGRAYYGQLGLGEFGAPGQVSALPAGATHADVAVAGDRVAVAWKRFDGKTTNVETWISQDGGRAFVPGPVLRSTQASDQPRLVSNGDEILLVWRRLDDVAVARVSQRRLQSSTPSSTAPRAAAQPQPQREASLRPFEGADTLARIQAQHAGTPYWLVLWDLECVYCMKSLSHLAQAQREHPDLKVVTITTDSIELAPRILARLAELGVRSETYAFGSAPPEALRFAIDPQWLGEKPRAYAYAPQGERRAILGVISADGFAEILADKASD